jgi:hypothetical protein
MQFSTAAVTYISSLIGLCVPVGLCLPAELGLVPLVPYTAVHRDFWVAIIIWETLRT